LIVRIKTKGKENASKRRKRWPLLPLRRTSTGKLVAISLQPEASWPNAIQRCINDIASQLDGLTADFNRRVETAETNLFELVADAKPNDTIYIQGVKYMVDADGAVVLSPGFAKPGERERPDIAINEQVYEAVVTAMRIEATGVEAKLVILDIILNEPLVLLSKIADSEPSILGDVARFMVTVYGTTLDSEQSDSPRGGSS